MTYNELLAAIRAAIGPNGKQQITGQSLQDVLVNIATWAQEEEEATLGIISTSIEPTINANSERIDVLKERVDEAETHISNAELDLQKLLTDVPQLEASIGDKADLSEVASINEHLTSIDDQLQDLGENKATIDEVAAVKAIAENALQSIPTKVSELENDRSYVNSQRLDEAKQDAEIYTDTAITLFEQTTFANAIAGRAQWTGVEYIDNGDPEDVDIQPHTFYIFENPVTGELVVNESQTSTTAQGLEALSYGFQFKTGATAPTVNLPSGWRFPEAPTIEPNTTYQVSVVNGFALIVGWPNA